MNEIDIATFFQAYTAPLTYSFVNFTAIGLADNEHILPSQLPNISISANMSDIANDWVDSVYYGLNRNLKSQAFNTLVYGFPAHALAVNARMLVPDGINRTWSKAEPITVLSINPFSLYIYNALSWGTIMASLVMQLLFRSRNIPRASSFPDTTLLSKELDVG